MTGETLLSCLEEHMNFYVRSHRGFGLFQYQVRIHTQDRHEANIRAVNALRLGDDIASTFRLSLGCDVHRLATVVAAVFDLVDATVSGMIALARSQRAGGRLSTLRKALADELLSSLEISRTGIPPKPGSPEYRYREAVFEIFSPAPPVADENGPAKGNSVMRRRRHILKKFFRGDITRNKVVRSVVSTQL